MSKRNEDIVEALHGAVLDRDVAVAPAAEVEAERDALIEALECALLAEEEHDGHTNPDDPCWCHIAHAVLAVANRRREHPARIALGER